MITRKDIFNILFWIFLIIGIILVLWRIFGNSPSDLAIILPFILMLLFKIWSISDEVKDFKHDIKLSFYKVKNEIKDSEMNINNLRKDVDDIKTKSKR